MVKVLNKNAQGAIEFIIIFGAILFFFVLFLGIIQGNFSEKNKEKVVLVAQNVALDAREEINLAAESSNGYSRDFVLPENILGEDYELNVSEGRVYLRMKEFATSYKVFNVTGYFVKGLNKIRKEDGQVYLN